MPGIVEHRKDDRRQGPIRSGKERRRAEVPIPAGVSRSGKDRRAEDRRQGDRRATRRNGHAAD